MQKPHIRWMIRRDMKEVLEIETAVFADPWSEDDFITALRNRDVIGMVAEDEGGQIVGYMIYSLTRHHIEVINFAVSPQRQRQGVGAQMIDKLKNKLSPQRRNSLTFKVKDDNLGMHLFLRGLGFRATAVNRQYFENGQDAYHFVFNSFRREPEAAVLPLRRDNIPKGDFAA